MSNDPEQDRKDEARWRQSMARYRCRKCGNYTSTSIRTFDDDSHFPGIKYLVCGSCGDERPITTRRRERVRLS